MLLAHDWHKKGTAGKFFEPLHLFSASACVFIISTKGEPLSLREGFFYSKSSRQERTCEVQMCEISRQSMW